MMSVLYILLVLVLVGVVLWLIQAYVPMPATYKKVVIIVGCILMVVWVLQVTGVIRMVGAGPRVGG